MKTLLLLTLLCLIPTFVGAQTPPPVIFFTDLDSAPNAGGEVSGAFSGAYVTIYGNNFGASQGGSAVTWNGLNCLRVLPTTGAYTGWGMASLWYQKIIVQLGSGCTPGTGNFVVTTSTGSSAGLPFTVRSSGTIYCISTTGSDNNNGKFPSSCWATPPNAFTHMVAGDITYWEGGVIFTGVTNGFSGLDWGAGGTVGNPVAMVSYPGATPQPGVQCSSSSCINGIAVRCSVGFPSSCENITLAGMYIQGYGQALRTQYVTAGPSNQRYIGNLWTCQGPPGQIGCVSMSQNRFVKFFGNEISNIVSQGGLSKFYHSLYLTTDSVHQEVGWNSIHDNNTCRHIQVYSSPNDPTSGFNQYDISIHDNLIHDNPCDGINLATVDPSQGKVEVYNNLIYHVGMGPDPTDGEGDYGCIRAAQFINNSPPLPTGTIEIYNNTLVDCGSHPGTNLLSGAFILNPDNSGGTNSVRVRNNIVYQLSGEVFTNSGNVPSGVSLTGSSNNIWFGGNQSTPTWSTGNITTDPLFINRSANDYHLQTTSPAKAAATVIASANTFNNYPPWQGGIAVDREGLARPTAAPSIGAFDLGLPTFAYSSSYAMATPNGTQWSVDGTCSQSAWCYRLPVEPSAIPAGQTVVLSFGYDSTGNNQVFAVTDDKGNTYALDVTSTQSNNRTVRVYRATNVVGGINYVQIRQTGGTLSRYWQPNILVVFNANALDGTSCNANTSATISAGSITPTVVGDFIYQMKYSTSIAANNLPPSQSTAFTVGSQANIAWVLASQLLGDGGADQYGIYNSTAALNPTFTQATSDGYISCAVALKANTTGSLPTTIPRVLHQEHDAMPHNAPNPWKLAVTVDKPNTAVYINYVGNDAINSSGGVLNGVTSSPAPDVGWTASGPDFNGLNGHNHVNTFCAKWNNPPGAVTVSMARTATSNDSINMVYVVQNGTCNLDVDSGGQAGNQGAPGALASCVNCATPTKTNDIIFSYGGQFACTATSLSVPSGGVFDSAWFNGNSEDGPTQTDENNFWMHFYNGASLSPISVTWNESCDAPNGFWANRTVAYQSASTTSPAVGLSPTSLTFGNQTINTTSSTQSVTLTNTGSATLTIASISLTGTNAADFAIASNTCGASLAPGNTCAVGVTFHPTALASRSANLTFTTNATTSPDNAPLSGTGVSAGLPAANFTPTSLAFGPVKVSQSAGPTPLTLKNTGGAVMNISSISIAGTNAAEFSQNNTCGATLAVNATCAINVTFTPVSAGNKVASISVSSNTATSPDAAPLSGVGTTPIVSLSFTNINFFNQFLSTTSLPQVVVLTNAGTATLNIASIVSAGDFARTTTCGATLGAGLFCTISITFTPTILGPETGSITVTDDAAGTPHVIALSGTGVKQVSGIGTVSGIGIFKSP